MFKFIKTPKESNLNKIKKPSKDINNFFLIISQPQNIVKRSTHEEDDFCKEGNPCGWAAIDLEQENKPVRFYMKNRYVFLGKGRKNYLNRLKTLSNKFFALLFHQQLFVSHWCEVHKDERRFDHLHHCLPV